MGDYEGFRIKVRLKKDTPQDVINILDFVSFNTPREGICFDEDAPKSEMWKIHGEELGTGLLCMQSAYHRDYEKDQIEQGQRISIIDGHPVINTSSQPKWGHGIRFFLKWIQPYVDPSEYGEEVADSRTEYSNNKTYYAFTESGVISRTETTYEEDNHYGW